MMNEFIEKNEHLMHAIQFLGRDRTGRFTIEYNRWIEQSSQLEKSFHNFEILDYYRYWHSYFHEKQRIVEYVNRLLS